MLLFTAQEKRYLLDIVRQAIKIKLFNNQAKCLLNSLSPESTLNKNYGVFVTLKDDSAIIRGCMGCIHSDKPLFLEVKNIAVKAAFEDPRFLPLQKNEYEKIMIEISILSMFTPIKIQDIIIGKHGLFLKNGFRSGLLLPQVALEWNWDVAEFLNNLCQKAGISEELLSQPQTEVYSFEALVIREDE